METFTLLIIVTGIGYLLYRAIRKDPDPIDFKGRTKRLKRSKY